MVGGYGEKESSTVLTGTPATLSEQSRTWANAKPLYKPLKGRAGTSKNSLARIPPSAPITSLRDRTPIGLETNPHTSTASHLD